MLAVTKSPDTTGFPLPRPDIEHWWVVEAMIASHNHVYQVTYKTKYETQGPIGVSIHDGAPIASFQYEFLALSADAESVMDAVRAYPIPSGQAIYFGISTQPG